MEEEQKVNTITPEHIESILSKAKAQVTTAFGKETIASVQLPNGFVITASSACVDPANYDPEIGKRLCQAKVVDKLYELEGYRLQCELADPRPSTRELDMAVALAKPAVPDVARAAHEANRLYCESIGDTTQRPWNRAEDWQKQSAIAGVKAILLNPDLTPEEAHENWCNQKRDDGWVYGEEKIASLRQHPCLVPYDELPQAQKIKDIIFTSIVKALMPTEQQGDS